MALDPKKRASIAKAFGVQNTTSPDQWRPTSTPEEAETYNRETDEEIERIRSGGGRFGSEESRNRRIEFLERSKMEVPSPYSSELADDKRSRIAAAFGVKEAPEAAVAPDVKRPQGLTSAPVESPKEPVDFRRVLYPGPLRSGVLAVPEVAQAAGPDDVVLPSGTVLRRRDADFEKLFRDKVMPLVDKAAEAAERRYEGKVAERYGPKDGSWGEAIRAAVRSAGVGGHAALAEGLTNAGEKRREMGPARIVQDVMENLDTEALSDYVTDHLEEDEEYSAAMTDLVNSVSHDGDAADDDRIARAVESMTPEQRKRFEAEVAAEESRVRALQDRLRKATEQAWKRGAEQVQQRIVNGLVEEMARRNMPKGTIEAFARMVHGANPFGLMVDWAVGQAAGDDKGLHTRIMQRALEKYDPSIVTKIGAEAAGILLGTPVFGVGGAIGRAGAGAIRKAAVRNVAKRLMARGVDKGVTAGIAERLAARNVPLQLAESSLASGAMLGTYDLLTTPVAMAAAGMEPGAKDVLGAAGRGFVTGALLPGIGRVAGKAAESASTRAGKYAAKAGGFLAENAAFVGMGTLYDRMMSGEWPATAAELAAEFGHSIGVLGTMKGIGLLRRSKHRAPDFYGKVVSETEFTPEEVAALDGIGVDGRSYKRAVFDLLTAKDGKAGAEVASPAAEHVKSRYEEIMTSPEVPMTAKMKLMFLVDGRIPAKLPLASEARRSTGEDGRITVDLLDPDGGLVQRRTFSDERAAARFEEESLGLREINTIEYYKDRIEEQQSLDASKEVVAEYASEKGVPEQEVTDALARFGAGRPHDEKTVEEVRSRVRERMKERGDVASTIEDEISLKYGLGVEGFIDALTLRSEERTPRQQAAVAEYGTRLREEYLSRKGRAGGGDAPAEDAGPSMSVERQVDRIAQEAVTGSQNADDGMVYRAVLQDGTEVNVVKGEIDYDPETGAPRRGDLDTYVWFSPTVVVADAEGNRRMVSLDEIERIVEVKRAEESADEVKEALAAQLDAMGREEMLSDIAERGGRVRLRDGSEAFVDGVNEDGSYNVLTASDAGIATRRVSAEEIEGPAGDAEVADTAAAKMAEAAQPPVSGTEESVATPEPEQSQQVQEADLPRQKNGQPDYNAVATDRLGPVLADRFGEERTAKLARNNIAEANKKIASLEKQLDVVTDPNKADALETKMQEAVAQRERYAAVLEWLGVSEDAEESEDARAGRLKRAASPRIAELFPDGLPNVESVILADIAGGKKIRWSDKEASGAVVSRGLGSELGLADSIAERRSRFGILSDAGPTPEVYAEELSERLPALGIRFEEGELRDRILDVYGAVSTRREAREALERLASERREEDAPMDWEEAQQRRVWESSQRELQGEDVPGLNERQRAGDVASAPIDGRDEAAPQAEIESTRDALSATDSYMPDYRDDDVPFSVVGDSSKAPAEVSAGRWDAIVGQLERTVGADRVVTDPAAVQAKYAEIVSRGEEARRMAVEAVNARFNEELDRWNDGKMPSEFKFDLGSPGVILRTIGVHDLPMSMTQRTLRDHMTRHGLTVDDIHDLPKALEYPIMVYKWGTKAKSIIAVTEIPRGDDQRIAVAIRLKHTNNGVSANIIASVHGKDADRMVNEMGTPLTDFAKDNLKWVDKEKVLDWLTAGGSSGPSSNHPGLDSAVKIVANHENPKIEPEKFGSQGESDRFFRTSEGEVYGFTTGGVIYLDGARMNARAPMHEYTELWSQLVAAENPAWWRRAKELMATDEGRLGAIWHEVNDDPNYKDLGEDLRASETLSRATAELFEQEQRGISDDKGLFARLREVLREFWSRVRSALAGRWSRREIENLTAEEVAKTPLKDFVEGVDLEKYLRRQSEEKTLAGIHEISGEKLVKAFRQGGLANPSLAVVDLTRTARSGYGDVTLIASKDLIDQRRGRNAGTFDRDAWTPVYPKVYHFETSESKKKLEELFAPVGEELGYSLRREYYRYLDGDLKSNPLAIPFLIEQGESFDPVYGRGRFADGVYDKVRAIIGDDYDPANADDYGRLTESQKQLLNIVQGDRTGSVSPEDIASGRAIEDVRAQIGELGRRMERSEEKGLMKGAIMRRLQRAEEMLGEFDAERTNEYIADVFADHARPKRIDVYRTMDKGVRMVEELSLGDKFEEWSGRVADELGAREEFFAGYEEDGTGIYRPNTLSEVSKYMNEQGLLNTDDHGPDAGFSRFVSNFAVRMTSPESIRKRRGRLSAGEEEVFDGEVLSKEFTDLLIELVPEEVAEGRGYDIMTHEMVAEEVLKRLLIDRESVRAVEKEFGLTISPQTMKRVRAFGKKVREMPVRYFETKFARPVTVGEFAGAVIPATADRRIVEGLEAAGIPYRTYGTEEERDAAVRSFSSELPDVRFMRTAPEAGEPKLTREQQTIANLRRSLREVKASTRAAAKTVAQEVRRAIGPDLVEVMGKRTFDTITRQIEEATVRRDVERPLRRLEEIVVDLGIKRAQQIVDRYLALKVEGVDAKGVSVAKTVDARTRRMFEIFRKNLGRPAEEVRAELRNRSDSDLLYDLDALGLLDTWNEADQYRRDVDDIEMEQSGIRDHNKQLRRARAEANKAGDIQAFEERKAEIERNNELLDDLDVARVSVKNRRLLKLEELGERLRGVIELGRGDLAEWKERQYERRKRLLHIAFNDVGDGKRIPVLEEQPGIWMKLGNRLKNMFLAPGYSMEYLLKMISVNAPGGEGALYDHFVKGEYGYVASQGRCYLGYEDFKKRLSDKAGELFGKSYTEMLKDSAIPTPAMITIRGRVSGEFSREGRDEGTLEETFSPTRGEALYIYMVNKMDDGRVKLRRMGIGDEQVEALAATLPDGYLRFADWIQEEFLPQRHGIYDETHMELQGTPLGKTENYVPLKILKSSVYQEVDGSQTDYNAMPSTVTGSIKKRRYNTLPLDLHTNAFDLMLEHGRQMERWNAYARVNRDMNELLSSTMFRRILVHRNPRLHKRMAVAAQIASGTYHPETSEANEAWVALSKLSASGKIAFRVFTAVKQVLSFPAFIAYSADAEYRKLLLANMNPMKWKGNFQWCLDNIPSFKERWSGRMAGNEKLSQVTSPKLDRWLDRINGVGMLPNAFVDALTCANGAKAVYDYKVRWYKKRGYSAKEADRLAKIDAAVTMNTTQQSSEGLYLSQMQVDRDFLSVSLSTFMNSGYGYLRKQMMSVNELFRDATRQRDNRRRYYKERGFSDKEAFDMAIADVAAAKRKAVSELTVFTFVMNMMWTLGGNSWKYIFTDDALADLPQDMLLSAGISLIRNTALGSMADSFANGHDANPSVLLSDFFAFANRLRRIAADEDRDSWNDTYGYLALQTLSANGIGVDIESFANMAHGIAGMVRDGYDVEDLMQVLNAPKAQARLIAGEPKEGETEQEYMERMMFIERVIESRVKKTRLDKWSRKYKAYRIAELLDVPVSVERGGEASVPAVKELDAAYEEALKVSGVTSGGDLRSDADLKSMSPEERERWRRLSRVAADIRAVEKRLEDTVVFNDAYGEQLMELMEKKREYIRMVKNE